MIFNSTLETVKYITKILDNKIEVPFYNLKLILDRNNISINQLNLKDNSELNNLALIDIEYVKEKSINLTLNSKSWIDYLPEIYQDNDFLKRFLFGFQATSLTQIEKIDNMDLLFQSEYSNFPNWLTSWFGIKYSNAIEDRAKRVLIYNMIELYKSRGTKKYFIKLIKIITNIDITIEEENIVSGYMGKSKSSTKRAFRVIIRDKISTNSTEEKRILKIINNIFDKEKPINTIMTLDYSFMNKNLNIEENSSLEQEKIIDFHNEQNDDYDYDSIV